MPGDLPPFVLGVWEHCEMPSSGWAETHWATPMECGSHLGNLNDLSSLAIGQMLWATFCPSWGKTGHIRALLVSTTKSTCEC